jgi:2-(1,2-epoxy-1,2-dihydrophenyl)acetyl-CoA isomerase
MRTDYQHLLIQQDGGVLTITMNRPEVLNAFNNAMLEELTEAVEAVAQDETVRCVVLTGAGRAFGSGQDLRSLAGGRASGVTGKVSEHLQKYHRVVLAIRNMPKPVIAAVHGHAAGISCNIALACDMRIAADDARFIEAFARIGLVPDGGGGYFLPHLIGVERPWRWQCSLTK